MRPPMIMILRMRRQVDTDHQSRNFVRSLYMAYECENILCFSIDHNLAQSVWLPLSSTALHPGVLIDHCDLSCLNIIRQPDNLSSLLDERRLPQSSNILPHAVLNPGQCKSACYTTIFIAEHLRACDFSKAHRLDLLPLVRGNLEQRLADLWIVEVRHATIYIFLA